LASTFGESGDGFEYATFEGHRSRRG
jgi:hypothetical protein